MLIQFIAILIMLTGSVAVLFPKFHGSLIILAGCMLYIMRLGINDISTRLLLYVILIAVLIEVSAKGLSYYLAKRYQTPPSLSTNAVAGNFAGIIVAEALFGFMGTVAFEAIISKTLLPRMNTMAKVLVRLALGAVFRLACGMVMIFLVIKYA